MGEDSGKYRIMATQAIKNYLNNNLTDDEINTKHFLAVEYVAENLLNLSLRDRSITSMTESSRNIAFNNNFTIIDATAKSLLPKPCIKLY